MGAVPRGGDGAARIPDARSLLFAGGLHFLASLEFKRGPDFMIFNTKRAFVPFAPTSEWLFYTHSEDMGRPGQLSGAGTKPSLTAPA